MVLVAIASAGCATTGVQTSKPVSVVNCSKPNDALLVTAARHFPYTSSPIGFWEREFNFSPIARDISRARAEGDLIITEKSLQFQRCVEGQPSGDPEIYPYDRFELAYEIGDWLFLRSRDVATGDRAFEGFFLHGEKGVVGHQVADRALSEVRKRIAWKLEPYPSQGARPKIIVMHSDKTEFVLATVDHGSVAANAGSGAMKGALAGVEASASPDAGPAIVLMPFIAAIGAVVGIPAGIVSGEVDAQKNALIEGFDDEVAAKVIGELQLSEAMASTILQRIVSNALPALSTLSLDDHCMSHRAEDCAVLGAEGVLRLEPPKIEWRVSKGDFLIDNASATYAISLKQEATLISTVSGTSIEHWEVVSQAERTSLNRWLEDVGRRYLEYLREAMPKVSEELGSKILRSTNKLIPIE
jgi:hypothetical protein